ncbi:MAG: ABC transporter substrate-binding protein [Acidimicrobiales bacterium]
MIPRQQSPGPGVSRRRFLQFGGMTALGILVAGCGDDGSESSTTTAPGAGGGSGPQANRSRIVVGDFNPNYAAQWGYHMADALGYMGEYGITEIEYVLSEEYVPGLLGGSLDIAHADTNVIIGSAEQSGQPLKMIGLYRINEWQIMGVRAGIDSPEDLIGGTITGGQLEGRNTVVQRRILGELGIDPDDVQFVATTGGSDGRLQALLAGTLDAASLFPRHRFALEEAGGQFLYEELVPAPQEGFAAVGSWLDENADTAIAWLAAELRGRMFVSDPANREEAFQTMRDRGFEVPPEFEELYDVEIEQFSPDGGFDVAAMDEFTAELEDVGDIPAGVEWRDHVDFTYLWAAQDALGIPRRPEL